MSAVYETPARLVRTGQVIAFAGNYRTHVEVDVVHHDRNDQGAPTVSFTGWTATTGRLDRGWTAHPDELVLVVQELHTQHHSYLTLEGSY